MFVLAILLWDGVKVTHTDEEWRSLLGRERYCVMRRKATEKAFTNALDEQIGIYACAACQMPLFDSTSKFEGRLAWPTFRAPIEQVLVWIKKDYSLPFCRYEVLCRKCDSHLGHIFRNAKTKELRYVINSLALDFQPRDALQPAHHFFE